MRAPKGASGLVPASTRPAPRPLTHSSTAHKPFGNAPKAVSRFAGCIPAPQSAGCGKGASFVDFSFAGKKSRKRDEWASAMFPQISAKGAKNSYSPPPAMFRQTPNPKSTLTPVQNSPCGKLHFLFPYSILFLFFHPACIFMHRQISLFSVENLPPRPRFCLR